MPDQPLRNRLIWFVVLWASGVATVTIIGLIIRRWLLG